MALRLGILVRPKASKGCRKRLLVLSFATADRHPHRLQPSGLISPGMGSTVHASSPSTLISTMLYQIHHQAPAIVSICLPHFITQAPYISRRDHIPKLSVPEATIDSCKFFFYYPRTIRIWNQLPSTAATAPAVAAFPFLLSEG